MVVQLHFVHVAIAVHLIIPADHALALGIGVKTVFRHNPFFIVLCFYFHVPQFLQFSSNCANFLRKIACYTETTKGAVLPSNLPKISRIKKGANHYADECSSIVNQKAEWEKLGVKLPAFDHAAMTAATKEHPIWVHFGAGNIFRGFIAALQQRLLNEGLADRGIIAADTFDYDIIDKIYTPYDNLTMNVTLNPDGTTSREIIGSIAEGLRADSSDAAMMARFKEIFTDPGLQMISFTITEKGYALYRPDGSLMPVVQADIDEGPAHARHAMSMVTALLLERFQNGAAPLAVVSMDNCSHNGEKLQTSVMTIAKAWLEKGYVGQDFIDYLTDESKIAFPWSMIDKITPRPHKIVEEQLVKDGIEGMEPIVTSKNTFIAAFVNAERPQYLVIEDKFPNGRPALEKAGVYLTDRDTVNKTERMKVTTCLNPLHTAMSVYGCMLGYTLICDEMKDADIVALIKRLGYVEGLPVVVNPGILEPESFHRRSR